MVTRDAVLTIFEECDRDNDGIVWLSEIKQLALSYTSSNEEELEVEQDEDVPLTFEDFLQKFAPQLKDLTPDPGTSSGISDCSTEPPIPTEPPSVVLVNYPFSPEEGFEGFGEASSEEGEEEELVLQDKPLVDVEKPTLSPAGSFRRKNSPFRLSQRRLKRSSAPAVIIPDKDLTVEDDLRQDIENITNKVAKLDAELSTEKNLVNKLRNEKDELHEKVLHLEELYRDLDVSSKKTERSNTDLLQDITDKYEGLKDSMESERASCSHQLKKYEEELRHSHKVKDTLTVEVVRLREVWAESQEQEAMWETKYNEMVVLTSQREQDITVIQTTSERERKTHTSVVKEMEDEIRILTKDIEEFSARKRSDTIIGRLQGKVDQIQEENDQLKEMTETMLSRDHTAARAAPLALEIDTASHDEILGAYTSIQKDYAALQRYVDKLLMNIIAEAPHLLCVDNSS